MSIEKSLTIKTRIVKGLLSGFVMAAISYCQSYQSDAGAGLSDLRQSVSSPLLTGGMQADSLPFGAVVVEGFSDAELAAASRVLPALAARGISVVIHFDAGDLNNAGKWKFVKEAVALGVTVQPWLLLDQTDGYWPGSTNAQIYAAAAQNLTSLWTGTLGLPPSTLVVDMELRIDRMKKLLSMLGGGSVKDIAGIVKMLRADIDRAQFIEATLTYAKLVNNLHKKGWRVHLTTLPMIADDYVDADAGIRLAFGIPVEGINWDEISLQAYRTQFTRMTAGLPLTPFFVYSYAKKAKSIWGDKASIDVGITGIGMDDATLVSPTYANADELAGDVEAAIAAGLSAKQVAVYNLQGMINRPPVEGWLRMPNSSAAAPALDTGTPFFHGVFDALDLLLP